MSDAIGASSTRIDVLVSYTAEDRTWAEWAAWQLEEAGYRTVIQAWDFRAGSDFVTDMRRAARRAKHTLAVLSPAYLASGFAIAEWNSAFAADPTGEFRKLVPVRVEDFTLEGLDLTRTYVDLVGLDAAFGEPPSDADLTLQQQTAWDAYAVGRAARAGLPTQKARRQYHFRNRHGFTDTADAVFARLWDAESLTWAEIEAACAESWHWMSARYDVLNPPAVRRLLASGTQLRTFPREVLQASYRASQELFAELGAQNPRFKRLHEQWDRFRTEQVQWARVAEDSLANFLAAATAQR